MILCENEQLIQIKESKLCKGCKGIILEKEAVKISKGKYRHYRDDCLFIIKAREKVQPKNKGPYIQQPITKRRRTAGHGYSGGNGMKRL